MCESIHSRICDAVNGGLRGKGMGLTLRRPIEHLDKVANGDEALAGIGEEEQRPAQLQAPALAHGSPLQGTAFSSQGVAKHVSRYSSEAGRPRSRASAILAARRRAAGLPRRGLHPVAARRPPADLLHGFISSSWESANNDYLVVTATLFSLPTFRHRGNPCETRSYVGTIGFFRHIRLSDKPPVPGRRLTSPSTTA